MTWFHFNCSRFTTFSVSITFKIRQTVAGIKYDHSISRIFKISFLADFCHIRPNIWAGCWPLFDVEFTFPSRLAEALSTDWIAPIGVGMDTIAAIRTADPVATPITRHFTMATLEACQAFTFSWKIKKINVLESYMQKYSRLRCLLLVKGLVICFYLGWSGSTLPIRTNQNQYNKDRLKVMATYLQQ